MFVLLAAATGEPEVQVPEEILEVYSNLFELFVQLSDRVEHPALKLLVWLAGMAAMFVIGVLLIKLLLFVLKKVFLRSRIDNTAVPFLLSVIRALAYVMLFVFIIGTTGLLDTASLVAILGVVGLAVSLAVQDSLSNLAGGALLLINKPFVKGDFVDVDGTSGTIVEISLTYTILRTVDNKRISIPNGQVMDAKITNFSSEPYRRMEVVLTVERNADLDKAEAVLLEALLRHPLTRTDPPASAQVSGHNDLGATISCRAWAAREDYWTMYFDLQKQLKQALDQAGIKMPVRLCPPVDSHG